MSPTGTWVEATVSRHWIGKTHFSLVVCALLLSGCSQTVDFDVRVVGTIDLDEQVGGALGNTATVDIPGGVVVPLQVSHRVSLLELDDQFAGLLAGSDDIQLLSVQYELTDNSADIIVPGLRVSVVEGVSDQLQESLLIARLPAFQPDQTTTSLAAVPWVPQGRSHLDAALDRMLFTTFFSGELTLREGQQVPTGSLQVELLITARAAIQ